jgi:hypothetical protein
MARSNDPLPGCAHWGQAEPTAQLRLGGFSPSSQQTQFEGNSIPVWPIAGIAAVAKT